MPPYIPDPICCFSTLHLDFTSDWETRQQPDGKLLYYCTVCRDGRYRPLHNAKQHENSNTHRNAVLAHNESEASSSNHRGSPTESTEQATTLRALTNDAVRALLASGTSNPAQPLYPLTSSNVSYGEPNFPSSHDSSIAASPPRMNWLAYSALEDTTVQQTPSDELYQSIFQKTLDFLNNGDLSDFSQEERPDSPHTATESDGDDFEHAMMEDEPRKRARLDARHATSSKDWYPWADRITCTLDILMHLPRSVFSRKQLDLFLWLLHVNKVDDVPTTKSMNLLNKMLQGMCGVDTISYNGKLGHVYHVNNLAQILSQEMSNPKVAPNLYFYPEDAGKRYFAKAWKLEARAATRDEVPGWVVSQENVIEVCENQLLKNFVDLARDFRAYNVPDPSVIHGIRAKGSQPNEQLLPWKYTNPVLGNPWRGRAKGHRVLSMPVLLYCDDTSGNTSKKWNEHNSFLFTLAGLPLKESAKEYNVHYLCTSNIAPPLEMMDGVVQQIEDAQKNGIWAWDFVHKELVMIFPTVLALLGDNPMHSEFACHIGLRGKYFCRTCWVKAPTSPSLAAPAKKPRGKFVEDMTAMLLRIKAFIKPAKLRTRAETLSILNGYFREASKIGAKSRLKASRTNTGIKDTVQEFFFDKLFDSYKAKQGPIAKQEALDRAIRDLPSDITSPVWRLKGLDPHQDTPSNYYMSFYWASSTRKKLLIQRLNSFNVRTLGLSPLGGETLVNYANSLTGRDFRAISQVAPFVIFDMVSPEVFDAWLSLSKLVPLLYQPVIEDINEFTMTLEVEIRHFSSRQRNGPVLGSINQNSIFFCTSLLISVETFESFNAVIRAKSVHSNRLAPSRDIALAFAQGNRIRHLLSGGFFLPADEDGNRQDPLLANESDWVSIGPGPRTLLSADRTLSDYLGIPNTNTIDTIPGLCRRDKIRPRPFAQTLTGAKLPHISHAPPTTRYVTNHSMHLLNNDTCSLGEYVLIQSGHSRPNVGCVREIIQQVNSKNYDQNQPDGILIQLASTNEVATKFQMPRVILQDQWSFVALSDILCTINTPHDCKRNGCSASGFKHIYQERIRTEHQQPIIEHKVNPDDLILNTAKMRDAIHIQKYRISSCPIDDQEEEMIISTSVKALIDSRKAPSAGHGLARGMARGRGVHDAPRARATSTRGRRGRGQGSGQHSDSLLPGESVIRFDI
ncbi:hypothetical protein BJ912DRAFT_1045365 [Pholiota molesta]|nr:hypothetical protein BJ912DRAFT_1045365 [Pholiota molesta]